MFSEDESVNSPDPSPEDNPSHIDDPASGPAFENIPPTTVPIQTLPPITPTLAQPIERPASMEPATSGLPSDLASGLPVSQLPVAHAYVLTFSTGARVQVEGLGFLGRKPIAPAGSTGDALIEINDSTKTVSKTHLQVEPRAEGLLVTDLSSTNGTVLSIPGVAVERLTPHQPGLARRGATVGIGEQFFTVQ